MKYYLHETVYNIVWKGVNLTALEFYERLNRMFLRGDLRSRQALEDGLNGCVKKSSETLLQWWSRLDSIFAEFEVMNAGKTQEDKKAKAIYLIGDEWATLAELLDRRM